MSKSPTIWEALATKLGRQPTHNEACAKVAHILGTKTNEERIAEYLERRKVRQ